MKNRKRVAFLAGTAFVAFALTGCFGQKKADEVVVEESTFPEVEEKEDTEVTPEPTKAPEKEGTVYLSKNKQISIQLPDDTWANKTDEEDLLTFESADQGSILITHASQESRETMQVPDSEQAATSIEEAAQLKAGTDFELVDYQSKEDEDGNAVYSYRMNMLDPEKTGYANILVKVFANDSEIFQIRGTVKAEDPSVLEKIQAAIDHVGIYGGSALSVLAPMEEHVAAVADTPSETESQKVSEEAETDTQETSEEGEEDGSSDQVQGITPYRDNPDNSDTNLTRTIYRNSDGYPIVISANSNGTWVDEHGNVYRFADNEIDVYDQDDVDYYWHGEAADVYYLPIETDE